MKDKILTLSEWACCFGGHPKLCKKYAGEFRECLRACDMRIIGGFSSSSLLTYTEFMTVYLRVTNVLTEWAGLRELFNFK